MPRLSLRVVLASVPLLAAAPLLAQRPTPAIEHQKRAATLEYGAVPLGKHTLAELPNGGTWRLGNNEASVLRLDLPLLAGDTIVAPGSYRVQVQRTGETTCAFLVNGSQLAVGASGDASVPGTLGKAAKPTKKLDVQWRKAKASPDAAGAQPNLPVQLVATFGPDELVADATLLGHEAVTVPGWKAVLFHVPAARLEAGTATPVATFRRGDDQWNLVASKGKVELVPCMAAPTEQFGFGAVQGPAADAIVAGAVAPLEAKVDGPLAHSTYWARARRRTSSCSTSATAASACGGRSRSRSRRSDAGARTGRFRWRGSSGAASFVLPHGTPLHATPRTSIAMKLPALLTLLTTVSLLAQDPAPATPAAPSAPAAAPLPAAGSPAATELVDKALTKMLAYGRGTFATTEHQDRAMLRNVGLPFGDEDTEVTGGWHRGLVWGEHDGSEFLRANGRMVAKVGSAWKLRGKKLGSGVPVPFALDPELLFTVLSQLPADARKVAHVEAGEVAGKPVAILSLELAGEAAAELADSGALPGGSGGPGGFVMIGGPGGMAPPESDYTVYVALFVDPASGDLLRLSTKTFENNEQMGNVRIQVQGGGGGDDEDEAEAEDEKADTKPAAGDAAWKKGLPVRKPAKTESVTTYRVDFKKLGLAEAPQLDDKTKQLLRL